MNQAVHPATGAGQRTRLFGWGRAVSSVVELVPVASAAELRDLFARATREGLSVVLRGAGCSYGDAALNRGGIVADLTGMRRILAFDRDQGTITVEPGVTIGDLWRHVIPHGFWPPVVPGTMFPTLGGCLGMNIHGKNNFRVGTIGEHVTEFTLLTPAGTELRCSRAANADIFRAAIGGFGMLGAIVSITLRLKHVPGGRLQVSVRAPRSLAAMIESLEADRATADYLVGWIDGFASGAGLGRGIIHRGDYVGPDADPAAQAMLDPARQDLPTKLLGIVPKRWMWRFLRFLLNDLGMRAVNRTKDLLGAFAARFGKPYLQPHAAFAFLLDYVPDWKLGYGGGGLIQYQSFIPASEAARVHGELIRRSQEAGLVPYLLVYKRHRRDDYLLTHSVDGFSMAMDFKVTFANRRRLWRLCRGFDDLVIGAGGRFYFAKDATLLRSSLRRAFPAAERAEFLALKERLDPAGVLSSDLFRRLFS